MSVTTTREMLRKSEYYIWLNVHTLRQYIRCGVGPCGPDEARLLLPQDLCVP